MPIALDDLVGRLQLFVVLILDAEGAADVVDAILIGRRVVAARGFVADRVGVFPVRVHVAAGHRGARLGVIALGLAQRRTATPGRRAVAIEVQARGRTLHGLLDLPQAFPLALESGRLARSARSGGRTRRASG